MNNNKTMIISIGVTYIAVLTVIFVYLIWGKNLIDIPPCPIYKYTRFYCPACGGTRAIISLSKGDFIHSFTYNPIVLYTLVFSSLYLVMEIVNIKLKSKKNISWRYIVYLGLIILVINCIVQNIIKIL